MHITVHYCRTQESTEQFWQSSLLCEKFHQVDTKTILITLIQPKITYCLSDKAGRLTREAIWIRKTDNMNRDKGSYQLSHVWDKLLHTTDTGSQSQWRLPTWSRNIHKQYVIFGCVRVINIIFHPILQTITIPHMLSTGGGEEVTSSSVCLQLHSSAYWWLTLLLNHIAAIIWVRATRKIFISHKYQPLKNTLFKKAKNSRYTMPSFRYQKFICYIPLRKIVIKPNFRSLCIKCCVAVQMARVKGNKTKHCLV